MTKPKCEIWFLTSCVEIYKDAKSLTGRETYNYLQKTGAIEFIIRCWDGLHTTSASYIVDSIDEYIANHSPNKPPDEKIGSSEAPSINH